MRTKIRSFTVSEVDNGFQVQIGCKNLVFQGTDESSLRKFVAELEQYILHPEATELVWATKYGWGPPEPMPKGPTHEALGYTIGGVGLMTEREARRAAGLHSELESWAAMKREV